MSGIMFPGKSIIITGASSGIGRSLAFHLSKYQTKLTLTGRDQARLDEVAESCRKNGSECVTVSADLTIEENCRKIIANAIQKFGKIDILINNAGLGMHSRFDEITDLSIFDTLMKINFFAAMWCTFYALPSIRENKGSIVTVSSWGGIYPSPFASAYGASKHALVGLMDSLRPELEDSGVTVTVVFPGWVATGISSRSVDGNGKPLGTALAHENNAMNVDDCAEAILKAIKNRKREVIFGFRGKIGRLMNLVYPKRVDQEGIRTLK